MGIAFAEVYILQVSALIPNYISVLLKNRKNIPRIIYMVVYANKNLFKKSNLVLLIVD